MAAMAWMNYGGYQQMCGYYAPIIPVAAPAPPTLTWSVSLYERPVYVAENLGGRIGTVNVFVGEYTYVDATAQLSTGAYVNLLCQGGPSLPNGSGNLIGSCASGYNTTVTVGPSGPGLPGNSQVGGTYSCGSCGVVVQLLASVDAYQQSGNFASYSPTANGGYNSNSYAFTLLEDIGLAGYTPAGGIWSWFGTPWLAPGWGEPSWIGTMKCWVAATVCIALGALSCGVRAEAPPPDHYLYAPAAYDVVSQHLVVFPFAGGQEMKVSLPVALGGYELSPTEKLFTVLQEECTT